MNFYEDIDNCSIEMTKTITEYMKKNFNDIEEIGECLDFILSCHINSLKNMFRSIYLQEKELQKPLDNFLDDLFEFLKENTFSVEVRDNENDSI